MAGHSKWADIKRQGLTSPTEIAADVYKLALPLLVERLGGVVEITEAEQEAFAERQGGIRKVAVQIDRTPTGLRLTIVHKGRPPLS
jgi:hypothetical protein